MRHLSGDSFLPLGYPFVLPREEADNKRSKTPYNATLVDQGFRALKTWDVGFLTSGSFLPFCSELIPWAKDSFGQMENKELKAIVVLMVILVLTFIQFVRKTVRPKKCYDNTFLQLKLESFAK